MSNIVPYSNNFLEKAFAGESISHLTQEELEGLTNAFRKFYDSEE
jgi:hypothetical protein